MHCFCYGSNLNLPHLYDYVTSHGVDTDGLGVHELAILEDHQLRSNYVSCTHGAAACNVELAEGSMVEGLVIQISPAVRDVIRAKEGWPDRYQEVVVEVLNRDRRQPLRAITYIVNPDHRLDVDMPVTPRYRRLVLEGAKAAGLSKFYQEQLARLLRATEASVKDFAGGSRTGSRQMSPSSLASPG